MKVLSWKKMMRATLVCLVLPFLTGAVPLKLKGMRFMQAPAPAPAATSATPLPKTQSKTTVESKEYHKFFEALREGKKLDSSTDGEVKNLETALGAGDAPAGGAAPAAAADGADTSASVGGLTNSTVSSLEQRIADHAFAAAQNGVALPGQGTSTYFKLSPHVSNEAVLNLQNVHAQLIKNAGPTAGLTATPGTPEYEQQLKEILGVKGMAANATLPGANGGVRVSLGSGKHLTFQKADGTIINTPMPGAPPFGMDHDMITPGNLTKLITEGHITNNGQQTIAANGAQKHLIGAIASVADQIDTVKPLNRKDPQYHGKGMYVNVFNALTPPPPAPAPGPRQEPEESGFPGLKTPPELLNPLTTVLPYRAPESPCKTPECGTPGSTVAPKAAGVSSKFSGQPGASGAAPVDVQSMLPVTPTYKPDTIY